MRHSNHQFKNQYYQDLTKSNYTSITSRKLKSSQHHDINDTKTKFYNRLEKACPTLSNTDINKEFNLYRKQIERLEKEILKKDKIIFENKATFNFNKELEAQLIETYRIIYLYEGKMNEYERQLKKLELVISQKMQGDVGIKVEELLQSYRKQNGQLRGQIQQKNRLLFELESKIKKLQNKYFSAAWKLSSTKRQIFNPLKKKFPNLRNTITIKQTPLIQKEKQMNQNIRINQKLQSTHTFPNDYQQIINYPRITPQNIHKSLEINPNEISQKKQQKPIVFKKIQGKAINIEYGYSNNHLNQNKIIQLGAQDRKSNQTISLNSSIKTIKNDQSRQLSAEKRIYASPINRYEINKQFNDLQQMMKKTGENRYSQSLSNRVFYYN